MTKEEIKINMMKLAFDIRRHQMTMPINQVSAGENGILCGLLENYPNPVCSGEIAEKMGIGTGRVGNALKSLEKKGKIYRIQDEEDKRKVLVYFTQEGYEQTKESYNKMISFIDDLIDLYGLERMSQFLDDFKDLIADAIEVKKRKEYEHIW